MENKEKKLFNPQTKYWNIIVESVNNENGEITEIKKLHNYLNYQSVYFAEILHDKCIDENNEKVRPHHHIITILKQITRKSTLIKTLSKILNINENLITIKKLNDVFIETQYLTHQNEPQKYQYPHFLINTNNKRRVNEILNATSDNKDITATELIEIIYKENNYYKILKKLGLEITKKYHFIIIKLLEEKNFVNRMEVIKNINENN